MIVGTRAVRDRARSVLWWSLGIAASTALMASMFPSIAGNDALQKMFDDMPAAVKMLAGAPEGVSLVSPAGYIHSKLLAATLPTLLLIFGIGAGATAIGGSEQDGTLELLLSNPVTRTRVAVERYLALVALLAALTAVGAVSLVISLKAVGSGLENISVGYSIAAVAGCGMIALVHASLAFAAGCVFGRRARAVAVATVIAVGGYLFEGITATSSDLHALGAPSPWHWYLSDIIIIDGPSITAFALPLVASVVFATAGVAAFNRRDLR